MHCFLYLTGVFIESFKWGFKSLIQERHFPAAPKLDILLGDVPPLGNYHFCLEVAPGIYVISVSILIIESFINILRDSGIFAGISQF